MKTNTIRISTPLFLALALGLGACDDSSQFEDVDPPAEATERSLEDLAVPTEIYYTATRDYRKCAAPMCGGFFLRAVNRSTTTCAASGGWSQNAAQRSAKRPKGLAGRA